MSWTSTDYRIMAHALGLAARGRYTAAPNPVVGCVFARDGNILAGSWHERSGEEHAEARALRQGNAQGSDITGSSCYVTLEPCAHQGRTPPCVDALIAVGVREVFAAMPDPNPQVSGKGLQALRDAGVRVDCGLLERQARALNPGFIKRMEHGMPWVCLKSAVSLDGRTALANGESQWITSAAARRDGHRLRARSCALLTGVGTVLADDPRLTARDVDFPFRPPLRVILDSDLRTPPTARMFSSAGRILIFTGSEDVGKQDRLREAGAETVHVPMTPQGRPALTEVLRHLAQEEQTNEVLVEAGAGLSGALLREGLVDQMVVYMAAMFLGSGARGMLELENHVQLADCPRARITDFRHLGPDIRLDLRFGEH